jgi:hypothetical protein
MGGMALQGDRCHVAMLLDERFVCLLGQYIVVAPLVLLRSSSLSLNCTRTRQHFLEMLAASQQANTAMLYHVLAYNDSPSSLPL